MKPPVIVALAFVFACLVAGCLPQTVTPTPTPEGTVTLAPTLTLPPAPTATQRPLPPRPTRQPRPIRTGTPIAVVTETGLEGTPATPAPTPTRAPRTQAGHLTAFHRDGQTFLAWDEQTDLKGERYRVYRSNRPIQIDNLGQTLWLAEVSRGSGNFYANRYLDSASRAWQSRNFNRYPVYEGGLQLPDNQGFLVWTPSREDLSGGDSASAYYAVTVFLPDGVEELPPGYMVGPIDETLNDPLPLDARYNPADRTHIMVQYMDLRSWNPTFHAPNIFNQFYGLPRDDFAYQGNLQYAYDYIVQEPYCPNPPARVPVLLVLHDRSGYRNLRPEISNEMAVWCAYKIYPLDPGDTWWFGFAQGHDYRQNRPVLDGDIVVNYTEQRLLRMVYDLARRPPGLPVDINRIYVTGHSMGGTGALSLAMRYGNVFAAAYASDPLTDPREAGNVLLKELRAVWGEPRLHLPVSILAPLDWAQPLNEWNGTDVWEWMDAVETAPNLTRLDFAPIGVAHALNDPVINWVTQGERFYNAMDKSRQVWGGMVTRAGRNAQFYDGFPPILQPDNPYVPFFGLLAARNEAVLAVGSGRGNFRAPAQEHGYNQTMLWSSSWLPWDGVPVDKVDTLQFSLCAVNADLADSRFCGTGEAQVINLTPRRMQRFLVVPGVRYTWENRRFTDDELIASGRVTADEDGTLTIRRFLLLPEGNRLIIRLPDEESEQQ